MSLNSSQPGKPLGVNTQAGTPEADCVAWSPWPGAHSQAHPPLPPPPTPRPVLGRHGSDSGTRRLDRWDPTELWAGWHLRCGALSQHCRWFAESRWSRRPGQNRVQENARDWRWAPCPSTCQRRSGRDKGMASRELLLREASRVSTVPFTAEEGGALRDNVTC